MALREFLPLAMQGVVEAQYNLGVMYREGKGGPQDYSQAAHWSRLAAEQGLAEAQRSLAVLYSKGLGVSQDDVQAYSWFDLTATRMPPGPARDAWLPGSSPASASACDPTH